MHVRLFEIVPYYVLTNLLVYRDQWEPVWTNANSGLTTNIQRHLETRHEDTYTASAQALKLKPTGLKHLIPSMSITHQPYNKEAWQKLLVRWAVVDDQALRVVDTQEFRDFTLFGRPPEHERHLPHRTSLEDMVFREYHAVSDEIANKCKVC